MCKFGFHDWEYSWLKPHLKKDPYLKSKFFLDVEFRKRICKRCDKRQYRTKMPTISFCRSKVGLVSRHDPNKWVDIPKDKKLVLKSIAGASK